MKGTNSKIYPTPIHKLFDGYKVESLKEYIQRQIKLFTSNSFEYDSFDKKFREFLRQTLVVSNVIDNIIEEKFTLETNKHLDSIIMDIIKDDVRNKKESRHILSRGFNESSSKENPITLNYINTTFRIFKSEEWIKLHNLIGDNLMNHILKSSYLFIKLKRNNFLQISGYDITRIRISSNEHRFVKEHITNTKKVNDHPTVIYKLLSDDSKTTYEEETTKKRKREEDQYENDIDNNIRNVKRICTSNESNNDDDQKKIKKKKPRLSIWRRRALKKAQKMTIEKEETPKDKSKNEIDSKSSDEVYKINSDKTQSKMTLKHKDFERDIFYISPFSGPTGLFHNYILCKLRPTHYDAVFLTKYIFSISNRKSLPKRLFKFINVGKSIIKRCSNCRITKILREMCTIESKSEIINDIEDITLENYFQLADYYVSHQKVSIFIYKILRRIFPPQTFGSLKNWNTLRHHVNQFIRLGRFEKMNTSNVIKGFTINDISWLKIENRKEGYIHLPPSDSLKRHQLFIDFLYWLFDDFICSLLRNNFFCTESGNNGQKTFYYRKDIWKEIHTKCLEDSVKKNLLQPISKEEFESILRNREIGFSYIRFLPSTNKFRSIINMGRKNPNPFYPEINGSINQKLKNIHNVLRFEKEIYQNHIVGSSIFTYQELFDRLLLFKQKLNNTHEPYKLFFVKADISKAFDRIRQDKLIDILQNSFHLDHYLMYTYNETRFFYEKCSHIRKNMIFKPPDFPQIKTVADIHSKRNHNTIISDHAMQCYISKDAILDQIKQHIYDNLIKSGNKYYRSNVGIPQGSCLSSILCAIYYGDMENKELIKFINPNMPDTYGELFRWVDDFLYITTSRELANQFVEVLKDGFPEYGCTFNKNKTTLNFIYDGDKLPEEYSKSLIVNDEEWFSWCGFYVNTRTLEVKKVSSVKPEEYSMTVSFNHPFITLKSRLLRIIQRNICSLLFDLRLNSLKIVCLNMIHLFFECGNRILYYINRIHSSTVGNKKINDKYIIDIIYNSISTVNKSIKTRELVLNLCENEILYIGLYSFYNRLKVNTKLMNVSIILKNNMKEIKKSLLKCKFDNKLCIKWAMRKCKKIN